MIGEFWIAQDCIAMGRLCGSSEIISYLKFRCLFTWGMLVNKYCYGYKMGYRVICY